ncbi:KilA-N domain-containing protein [Azorhizophilus paspali]|uniref:KilA-N domain-containing protein n=1 Tax=Azorhizophilus paspali TaxID=69963 RepID=A0ABV6SNE8_AZOPA
MSNVIPLHYQGHQIRFNTDGWLHATEISARFGREPYEWLRLPDTVGYLVALARALGAETKTGIFEELNKINGLDSSKASTQAKILRLSKATGLVKTRAGAPETGGGTWLHPKLAVAFARWLNVDFAVWCDLQIDALLHGGGAIRQHYESACRNLEIGQGKASISASELARWRWRKPGLEHEFDHWRNQLQMTLGFDAA